MRAQLAPGGRHGRRVQPTTSAAESRTTVLFALAANVTIFLAKLVVGLVSGSKALLAEAAHSFADTLNQLLMLLSLSRSRRPPDAEHPFGHGKESFFCAALLIFAGGAAFSIAQGALGIAGVLGEHPILFGLAYAVLGFSLVAESIAFGRAFRHVRRHAFRERQPLLDFVAETPNPTLKVVLFEDGAAVVGVLIALAGVLAVDVTGQLVWDGVAAVAVGVLLAVTAFVLARDAKALLIGQAARPHEREAIEEALLRHEAVESVAELLTMHLGPERILVAARVELRDGLSTGRIEAIADELRAELGRHVPAATDLYLHPIDPRLALAEAGSSDLNSTKEDATCRSGQSS